MAKNKHQKAALKCDECGEVPIVQVRCLEFDEVKQQAFTRRTKMCLGCWCWWEERLGQVTVCGRKAQVNGV